MRRRLLTRTPHLPRLLGLASVCTGNRYAEGDVVDDVVDDAPEDVGIVGELSGEPESEPAPQEAEAEPDAVAETDHGDGDTAGTHAGLPVDVASDAALALPPEVRPSLEQYTEKWAQALAAHARPVAGEFSSSNLVPRPI